MGTVGVSPSFGELLKQYRVAAGLTQEELAAQARLSARAISDHERGARRAPYRATVQLLAAALQLAPVDYARLEAAARHRGACTAVSPDALTIEPGRHLSPLVGRRQEVAAIEGHLAGKGPPVLLLAGEPGIGKSRLLQEAAERAQRSGWTVLQGGCQRSAGRDPYAPLLEAMERHVRWQPPARLGTVLQGCGRLVRLLPELAEIKGALPDTNSLLAPEQERRLLIRAVARFLANVAAPAGVVLVLDDLQWAGVDALDLLAALLRNPLGDVPPVRVVGAYRDTEVSPTVALSATVADLASGELVASLPVGPLQPYEAAQLLDRLLDGAVDPGEALRARILRRADAVPFFLVSCARGLHTGALRPEAPDSVPWTLMQSLRQRAAALPEAAQDVLRVAAIVGRRVSRDLLCAVVARTVEDTLAGIECACHAHLLQEDGADAYRFAHDVIRDVVEADLGAARRVVLHRQVADALANRPGEPPVEELAYHYARAEAHAIATEWLERAGDRAAEACATTSALEHYVAARTHAQQSGADGGRLSRLDEKMGDLRLVLGQYAQAQQDFARARQTDERLAASRGSEEACRAELHRKEGVAWTKQGAYDRALAAFTAAAVTVNAAGRAAPTTVRAALALSQGEMYLGRGDCAAAVAAGRQAEALMSAEPSGKARDLALARAAGLQGYALWALSDFVGAEECYTRSLPILEQLGDPHDLATCWDRLGLVALDRGDLAQAEQRHRRSLAIQERLGDPEALAWCWDNLGMVAFYRGDLTEAEACFRRSLSIQEPIGLQRGIVWSRLSLGHVALQHGDWVQAEAHYRWCLTSSEGADNQTFVGYCCTALGLLASYQGGLAEAEACYRRSLSLVERSGDAHGIAECWLALGQIATARGDLAAAARCCRDARRLARRLGTVYREALACLGEARARLEAGRIGAARALLAHGRSLAATSGLAVPTIEAALLDAEMLLRQGQVDAARMSIQEALQRASGAGMRREEALAYRLVGQCALAAGAAAQAEGSLRRSLAMLTDLGAALDAARTQVVLAEALVAAVDGRWVSDEARALVAEAQSCFAACGANLDAARVGRLTTGWPADESASCRPGDP